MKIPIKKFENNWQIGNGAQRVIDNKGTIIAKFFNPNGGISVDWVSSEWLEKEGVLNEKDKLQHKEGEHIHVFFKE